MKPFVRPALGLILAAAMTLAMTACSSGKTESSGGVSSSGGGDGAKTFGGRTVVLGQAGNGAPQESSPTYAQEVEFIKNLEEKYDCKIEWYYTGDWHTYQQEILTTALSGGKIADAFAATGLEIFPKWALNDLIVPLDDYFDFTNPIWNAEYSEFTLYNNQHYGISNWSSAIGSVVMFNKRLCASYGISDEELYKCFFDGEWTWEKLAYYAQKCTKIGTNENDSTYGYGKSGVYSPWYTIYQNGSAPIIREGNKYTYNLTDEKAIAAMQFMYDLAYTYKVTPDLTYGTAERLFKKGKVAFMVTAMWAFPEYAEVLQDDEIGILLEPKGPSASDYVNITDAPAYWFMQPQTEDKALVAQLVTDMCTPREWAPNGGVYDPAADYANYVFDDESIEVLRSIEGKTIAEYSAVSSDFKLAVLWSDFGLYSKTDPRTYAEANKASAQFMLDNVWTKDMTSTLE